MVDRLPAEVDHFYGCPRRISRSSSRRRRERNTQSPRSAVPAATLWAWTEKDCILGKKGDARAIGRLERFLADREAGQGTPQTPAPTTPNGRRVAVVGSGPAGLTVAADLALLGYGVTLFEALHEAGGVLTYGIPEFRLPKSIVRREVRYVESLGVELRLDFIVGKTRTVERLADEFDAVFVGAVLGPDLEREMPVEHRRGDGHLEREAVELLERSRGRREA